MTSTVINCVVWISLLSALAFGQDYTDECPERFGFYADAVQCDRYYECKDGEVSVTFMHVYLEQIGRHMLRCVQRGSASTQTLSSVTGTMSARMGR